MHDENVLQGRLADPWPRGKPTVPWCGLFCFCGPCAGGTAPFFVDVHVRIQDHERDAAGSLRAPHGMDDRKLCHSVEGGYFLILS